MEIKKHGQKIFVFGVNLLIVALIICGIKDKDKNKIAFQDKSEESIVPVNADILELQNKIATDRENKLRDINGSPKDIKQENITTTTKTVVPVPAPTRKTKTS
jgi:hypothetical protein